MRRSNWWTGLGTALTFGLGLWACSSTPSTGTGGSGTGGGTTTVTTATTATTTTTSTTTTSTTTTSTTGSGGGGPCGACVTIATLPLGSAPQGLFVDADNVYWTNAGTGEVMQAKKDGTGVVTLATEQGSPFSVVVSEGFVYWISYSGDGTMRKAPIGGGSLVDIFYAPAARELVVAGGYVFWTREPDDIERVPIDGVEDGGSSLLLSLNVLSNGITADKDFIYWVTRGDNTVKRADYMLGNEEVLAIGDQPWDLAIDDTNIYWTERGSAPGMGRISKVPKAGGATTELAPMQDGPRGIAVDATHVYWANQEEHAIRRVPINGGPVELLASDQEKPVNVAVDATHVYWTSSAGDVVRKLAK